MVDNNQSMEKVSGYTLSTGQVFLLSSFKLHIAVVSPSPSRLLHCR